MGIEFLKGIIVGLGASIPLGPIGVLCVQRTINKGRLSGFLSGMGAACADTIFALFAILGLAIVQQFMQDNRITFLITGGLIVAFLGLKIYLTNPIKQLRRNQHAKSRFFEDFLSTFLLTLSNPGAIFLVLGLFTLVKLDLDQSHDINISIVLGGVIIGTSLWWFILSTLIDKFRKYFRIRQLWVINRIAGAVIFVLGIISLFEGIWVWLAN